MKGVENVDDTRFGEDILENQRKWSKLARKTSKNTENRMENGEKLMGSECFERREMPRPWEIERVWEKREAEQERSGG